MQDHLNAGIDCPRRGRGRFRFRPPDICRAMGDLTLQVRQAYGVEIGHTNRANSRRGKIQNERTSQTACTDHQNSCGGQPGLPGSADFTKYDVTRISLQLLVGQWVRPRRKLSHSLRLTHTCKDATRPR